MVKKKDVPAMIITILLIFLAAQWSPTITIVVTVILFCVLLLLGNFLFEFAIWKDAKIRWASVGNRSKRNAEQEKQLEETESDQKWIIENSGHIWIQNKQNMWLHSYYMESKIQSSRYVILVHGYNGQGLDMAGMAKQFYERGYHIIMPDLRAHGQSDGLARGMGWMDHFDLMEWISCITTRFPDAEIILMGVSMGAAAVMMTVGEPLPTNVKACIEDCGYSSVWEEFESVQREIFHLPAFPILYIASLICRIRAGFWLQEADCVKQIQKSQIPILLFTERKIILFHFVCFKNCIIRHLPQSKNWLWKGLVMQYRHK